MEALPVAEVYAGILIEVCASFLTELQRVSTLRRGFVLLERHKRMGGKNESGASQMSLQFLHRERKNYCFFGTDLFFV